MRARAAAHDERPPRVAHVISTPAGIGGAERVLGQIVAAGAERGWDQIVLNPFARSGANPALQRVCGDVRYAAFPAARLRHLPSLLTWLDRRLAAFGPAIVHAHLFHALVAVATSRGSHGAWLVSSHHHGDHFRETGQRLYERVDRYAGGRFDRVVAVSAMVRDFLVAEYRYAPDRVPLIMNGWAGAPAARAGLARRPTIVCTANFRAQKDHVTLLEAVRLVTRDIPTVELLLVGGGELEEHLRRRAHDLGVAANVRFVGTVEDVWPYLAQAHVFALASRYEPLGIAILEAMAAGLPVVATAAGGIPELVAAGATGELVRPGDARAMARHLTRLLREPELREHMARAARTVAAEHSTSRMVEAYFGLYDALLAGGRPPRRHRN